MNLQPPRKKACLPLGCLAIGWAPCLNDKNQEVCMIKSLAIAAAFSVVCGLCMPGHALAQSTTATVSATCKDGTAFSGTSKKGACAHHGGVASYQTAGAAAAGAAPMAAKPAQGAMAGGAGQVWVNTASKVYHCPGDRYYGKTKTGAYMSQSAAMAAGDKPANGKACK
jgi:hypothetical protein